jgi:hypothetical protein
MGLDRRLRNSPWRKAYLSIVGPRRYTDQQMSFPESIMSTVSISHESSAYEALDRLLFREWDPLGVYAFNGPDDEYRDYLPEFWRLVSSGASARSIADYLGQMERDLMGVQTSDQRRLDIAGKAALLLTAWKTPIRE